VYGDCKIWLAAVALQVVVSLIIGQYGIVSRRLLAYKRIFVVVCGFLQALLQPLHAAAGPKRGAMGL